MRIYRFVLLGYYGFGNLGDELLLEACLKILGREKVLVLSNSPEETEKVFNVKSVNRWKFSQLFKAFRESEILVLGGGGLFQDSTSVASCVWYWAVMRLAKLCGVKIIALGQSIGNLNSQISKFVTKNALRICEKVQVRDENSFRIAKSYGCKNLSLGCDLVMTLKSNMKKSNADSLLINLRPCKELENYVKIISPHVKNFNGKKIGAALSADDEKVLEIYKNELSLEKIVRVKSFAEAENLWACASCCVGTRLHFGVLSRIFRTPLTLLPYDVKVEEFAKNSAVPFITDEWKEPEMPLKIPDVIEFEL